jgi:prepilin-type N-terminal cleavage/methylation domain-containing protein
MLQQRSRRGVTLIEVVVVVIVALILLALFLPMMSQSRGGHASRNHCANNGRWLAISLGIFEEQRREFPGYANVIHNKRASWIVPLLSYLEETELLQHWAKTDPVKLPLPSGSTSTSLRASPPTPNPWSHANLSVLVCSRKGNPLLETNPLSYVVNTGSARAANDFLPPITPANTWVEDINSGVFFNRARADFAAGAPNPNPSADAFSPDQGPRMTMDFIFQHDGTSNTIMLSENLQATTWATDPTDDKHQPAYPFESEFQIRQNTGLVWFVTGNPDNTGPAAAGAPFNPRALGINKLRDAAVPVPLSAGLSYARPSSNHPGGVNVYFCDNHYRFISEDIDYKVYTQLMTPNGQGAIVALPDKRASDAEWKYELNEVDY